MIDLLKEDMRLVVPYNLDIDYRSLVADSWVLMVVEYFHKLDSPFHIVVVVVQKAYFLVVEGDKMAVCPEQKEEAPAEFHSVYLQVLSQQYLRVSLEMQLIHEGQKLQHC